MAHIQKHGIDSVIDHLGVVGAVLDDIMVFDNNGLPKDGGAKVSDLALSTHTHLEADITDLNKYTTTEVDNLLALQDELSELNDTVITSVTDDELLSYDFASSKWINQTAVELGLSAVGHTHTASDVTDFDIEVSNNTDVSANTSARHTQNTDLYLDFGGTNQVSAVDIRNFIDSKAQNSGLAPLDASGKVPLIHLPSALIGAVNYIGAWDADTNSPTLGNSGAGGVKGDYYVVNVAGATSIDSVNDWEIGDWIVNNGSIWEKIDNTDKVSSVNGQTGSVVLDTDDVSEGTSNLYYTEARVSANSDVANNTSLAHTQNTDIALRTDKLVIDASGNTDIVGELSIKVYNQPAEPTLTADSRMAIWIDSDHPTTRTFLIFRRGAGDQISVELG